jgi:hypothetical protein
MVARFNVRPKDRLTQVLEDRLVQVLDSFDQRQVARASGPQGHESDWLEAVERPGGIDSEQDPTRRLLPVVDEEAADERAVDEDDDEAP